MSGGFKDAIQKFDGEFPVSHLKYTLSVPNNPNANASTLPPSNYIIEIKINPNKLDRPILSIARTFIHEAIHAEMWRKIMSILNNGANLNGLTKNEWTQKLFNGDFHGIFDYYTRFGVSGFQHQQMATHYRKKISAFLKEFQPGLSQEIYDSLAWTGLKNTVAWNSLSTARKNEINNATTNLKRNGNKICQ